MIRALKTSVIGLSTFVFCLISTSLSAQQTDTITTNFKLNGYLNSGFEHNLFYSPTSLRMADGSLIGKDSLIRSGGFATAGVNFSFVRNKGKQTFSINSSNYYKNYFSKKLRRFDNQNISLTPAFQYNFKKSDYMRFETVLTKNKMTRALTLDEESIIPLSYYRANPLLSYQHLLFKRVSTQAKLGYDIRKYKESTNGLDFSYGEIKVGVGAKHRQKVKKSILLYKVDYSYANRKYFNWSSQDEENLDSFDENEEENWDEK